MLPRNTKVYAKRQTFAYLKSTEWTQQTFVLVKTYLRYLQDVFSVTFFCLPRRFPYVLETSSRRNCKTSCKHVLKTSLRTSWRCFRRMYCKYVLKTSQRGIGRWKSVTLKTSARRLEQVLKNKKCLLGTIETISSKCLTLKGVLVHQNPEFLIFISLFFRTVFV